ncbi:MAG TPA: SLC13 family permease [Firmicutes bacterium]|nr:SLC13 family permease [Bacillota bacterium]
MNTDVAFTLSIFGAVILLFATGWIRMDIVPLLIPAALILAGLVSAEEVFAGFSSSAVITIAALFVITTGLVRSGVVNQVVDYLSRLVGRSRLRLIAAGTMLPGAMAGFIIVTATALFFIPTVMRLAFRSKIPKTKLLLPMVISCLLGANITLIGASHNLVVNSLVEEALGYGFSFFEFMPAGAVLLAVGVLYSLFFAWRLLPDEDPPEEITALDKPNLIKIYGLADRLWEIWVQEDSDALGKSIREMGLGERFGLVLVAVARAEGQTAKGFEELVLERDDVLLVLGREEKVRELTEAEGLFFAGHPREQKQFPLSSAELVELVIPPRSPVIGRTLSGMDFRRNTGLSGIALWRGERPYRTDVGNMPLQEGDGLLLFGDRRRTRSFQPGVNFRWLHPPRKQESPPELRRYGPMAIIILLLVITAAALQWLPVAVAAVTGAAAMVLFGILRPGEIYTSIEWRAIILIGCLYPLGTALENSGASILLTDGILQAGGYQPLVVLALISGLTIMLTQPLHNVAAAVIMTPVALQAASALGTNPKTFIMGVIIGASVAFLLPTGHPVVMLVKKPGGYRIKDYFRFGSGLVFLVFTIIIFLVPVFWPFN